MNITQWTTPSGQLLRQLANTEGDPLFVAKDVCEALGISNHRDAVSRLDDDEKADVGISDTSSNGVTQQRKVLVVTEPGLYKLMARSSKPEAKAFDRWVRHDVLPTIRKTGGYQARVVESDERIGHIESTIENLKLAINSISRQLGDLASGRCSREALSAIRSTVATAADRYFESGMFKSLRQARSKFNQQVLAACGWQGRLDDLPAHLVPRANLECSRIIAGLRQLTAQRQTKLKLN